MSAAPLRRSARKKAKYSNESGTDTKAPNERVREKEKPMAQRPGKTKTAHVTGRRSGKLACMSDMPLDVLFEIFGHLHPYDLLKLSRTTKAYRKLLLDPHSTTLWKTACQNVEGLPEPFEGICLPAWVNLLFYPHCHFCSRIAHTIEWIFRLRICSHCAPERLGKTRTWYYMGASRLSSVAFSVRAIHEKLIPTRHSNNHRETLYLQSEHDEVCAQYEALPTQEAREEFSEDRKTRVKEIKEHVTVCQAWEKKQSSNREHELQTLREERMSAIKTKLKELGWEEDLNGIRYPDSLSDHKLINKPQRLTQRIWSNIQAEVIKFMEQMREKRLKRERAALIVARKFVAADVWRSYQVSHVHDRQLLPNPVEFCSFQPVADLINQDSGVDVTVESFQDLLPKFDNFVSRWRQSITTTFYEQLKEPVPVHPTVAWDDYVGQYWDSDDDGFDEWGFYDRRPKVEPSPVAKLSNQEIEGRVKLARTVFLCRKCRVDAIHEDDDWYGAYSGRETSGGQNPLFYPQVLGHRCCDCKSRASQLSDEDFYSILFMSSSPQRFLPLLQDWSPNCLSIDVKTSNLAVHMLSAVDNVDPQSITVEEMDDLNIRYTCLQPLCAKRFSQASEGSSSATPIEAQASQTHPTDDVSWCSPSFDWRSAIQHQMIEHDGALECIKQQYAIEANAALPASTQEEEVIHTRDHTDGWICMHCDKTKGGDPCRFSSMKRHLSNKHGIEDITEDEDYTRSFDWLDLHPSPSFLRPARMTTNGPVLE
ncbi:hypothetical protein BJ165DRAFT_1522011 [Panaeolus papilionaceus]|nr:hypothetical protein BJ165DRAFT_1522011 [Panaeolus papilionaceus]